MSLATRGPDVLRSYFDEFPHTFLSQHHKESYEAFVFRELLDILHASNPITILKEPLGTDGKYKYRTEIYIGGKHDTAAELGVAIAPPTINLDSGMTRRRMTPNEARLRGQTYSATFMTDLHIVLTFLSEAEPGKFVETVREIKFEGEGAFPLFNLPILLRSKLCVTHQASPQLLYELGECRNDQGGYFVVDGAEKVLIARQEQAFNSIYAAPRPKTDLEIASYSSVVCQDPKSKQTRRITLVRFHANSSREEGVLRISIPFVKGNIPVFALFRAMGIESDRDIVRLIVPDADSASAAAMEQSLIPSIQDAWPIATKSHAIEFIRTLTKGFMIEHVLDIIQNNLFTHVPYEARPQYLAEMVRKLIRVEMSLELPTYRDDIRNQRLLGTGALIRDLFAEGWKVWKKAVILYVDKEYDSNKTLYADENFLNIFSPANIAKVMSSEAFMDVIMRGFRGKWGTNQYNMKTGVVQPLARISYLDAMSHVRRVVLEFDTSLKSTGPRHLHPSQIGYFCTSETPTGGHIGVSKNMSMMTAISVVAPTEELMKWLYRRGGVIPVNLATPSQKVSATSVQINGGTIGFTTRPGQLTAVLKALKWTACLAPTASVSFNTAENILRVFCDDGRPIRPLWHLGAGGAIPAVARKSPLPSWRDLVCGTLPLTKDAHPHSVEFVDPLASKEAPTLEEYLAALAKYVGAIEYLDPYEGNESYISWWGGDDLTPEHTHCELHPSTITGLLTSMIPFANHNQSPRNQLSCSQSKQGIGYYATNYVSRFDTYGSMLCYGEGPLARTIVYDTVAKGEMPYGTNVVFAINSFNGYNQDDGILFNRNSIQRGLFRSLALRSYKAREEEDSMNRTLTRIGNPRNVMAWTDLKPGRDYSALDEHGVIKEGTVIHDKMVMVGMYSMSLDTGRIYDSSVLPTIFTKGRVDKVAVLHQANGFRLVQVRIIEERIPELGDKFCLTPDHDVLTYTRGWVPIADVTTADVVYCLDPATNAITYSRPTNLVAFPCENEPMYELESQQVDLCATMNHKMWVQHRNAKTHELTEAKDVMGKRVRYQKNATNSSPDYAFSIGDRAMPMDAWLEFMGLWISDGWVSTAAPRRSRTAEELRIEICAVVKEHRDQVKQVCETLGFHVGSNTEESKLFIWDHAVAAYLKPLSVGAINKRLPSWVFELSERQSRILLEGLVSGDGYKSKGGVLCYYTSSKGLCEDVQRLCLHAGYSANTVVRQEAGHVFTIEGREAKANADAWRIGINRTKNYPMVNHGHVKTQAGQRESVISYTGSVHCIEVPTHIFYVRRNGKPVWTGNSSRHGQKGTMGMLLDAQDMPVTAEGIVPDVMVNPHCIPSRMTIAQLLEQEYGKLGAHIGAKMNATMFMNNEDSFTAIADALESVGFQRDGEEIMYSGITGKQFTSSVFIGPLYYMRLKHLTQDKLNARGEGRKEMLTHQPTGGRGNEGGMRIGEMERDSLIAHGVSSFLQESFMKRADGTSFWVCNGCGNIPISNEQTGLFLCPTCDGPISDLFQGKTMDTMNLVLPVRQSRATFSKVEMPFVLKLLGQEIDRGNYQMRFLTSEPSRRFREQAVIKDRPLPAPIVPVAPIIVDPVKTKRVAKKKVPSMASLSSASILPASQAQQDMALLSRPSNEQQLAQQQLQQQQQQQQTAPTVNIVLNTGAAEGSQQQQQQQAAPIVEAPSTTVESAPPVEPDAPKEVPKSMIGSLTSAIAGAPRAVIDALNAPVNASSASEPTLDLRDIPAIPKPVAQQSAPPPDARIITGAGAPVPKDDSDVKVVRVSSM